MFHLYCFLLYAYVLIRLVLPLQIAWPCRVVLGAILLVGAMNRLLCQLLFGNMFSPEMPAGIILAAGALMGAVLFMAALSLFADVIALILFAARRGQWAQRWLHQVRPLVLIIAGGLGVLAAYNGQKAPHITHVDIVLEDLAPPLDGLRVVQLSDLHVSALLGRRWLQEVVSQTNALKPDVVVITGDLIDGYVAARSSDLDPLQQLRATRGVYVSLGNHEYYFDHQAWSNRFNALGLEILVNRHVRLGPAGRELVIAAVADEAAATFGAQVPNAAKALQGVSPDQPIVLLRHRPTGIAESQQYGVDLQLSGHTHGGMISGVDLVVAAANDGLVSGMYQRGDTAVYVNNGTGIWNGFPLRLGRPAEITCFTLRAP